MKKLLLPFIIPIMCLGQSYPAHPRLWKPQLDYLATVAANPASPDYAMYQNAIAEANRYVPCFGTPTLNCGVSANGVASVTVTGAHHGYPTILTVSETITTAWGDTNFAVSGIGTPGDCWNANPTPYIYRVSNGSLISIAVASNVATVTLPVFPFFGGQFNGASWTVSGATVAGALNGTYSVVGAVYPAATFTFTTSGVANGTYTDLGLAIRWNGYTISDGTLTNIVVSSSSGPNNVVVNLTPEVYDPYDSPSWLIYGSGTAAVNGKWKVT